MTATRSVVFKYKWSVEGKIDTYIDSFVKLK